MDISSEIIWPHCVVWDDMMPLLHLLYPLLFHVLSCISNWIHKINLPMEKPTLIQCQPYLLHLHLRIFWTILIPFYTIQNICRGIIRVLRLLSTSNKVFIGCHVHEMISKEQKMVLSLNSVKNQTYGNLPGTAEFFFSLFLAIVNEK